MILGAIPVWVYAPGRFNQAAQVKGEGTDKTQHLVLQFKVGGAESKVDNHILVKKTQLVTEDGNAPPTWT